METEPELSTGRPWWKFWAHTNSTALAIREMVRFFLPHCADQSTMRELENMATDSKQWPHGHSLFSRIRDKTLRADRAKDRVLQYQYPFEEFCAKTLFNMSNPVGPPYPFDDDCPEWVLPAALGFARALGVEVPPRISALLQPKKKDGGA